jgi:hypothetical protein
LFRRAESVPGLVLAKTLIPELTPILKLFNRFTAGTALPLEQYAQRILGSTASEQTSHWRRLGTARAANYWKPQRSLTVFRSATALLKSLRAEERKRAT